jgi:hypothetical protein
MKKLSKSEMLSRICRRLVDSLIRWSLEKGDTWRNKNTIRLRKSRIRSTLSGIKLLSRISSTEYMATAKWQKGMK